MAQSRVLQAERDTIAEREALEREEEEAAAREKARLAERKVETHQIVVERVALEEAAIRAAAQVTVVHFAAVVHGMAPWQERRVQSLRGVQVLDRAC